MGTLGSHLGSARDSHAGFQEDGSGTEAERGPHEHDGGEGHLLWVLPEATLWESKILYEKVKTKASSVSEAGEAMGHWSFYPHSTFSLANSP